MNDPRVLEYFLIRKQCNRKKYEIAKWKRMVGAGLMIHSSAILYLIVTGKKHQLALLFLIYIMRYELYKQFMFTS